MSINTLHSCLADCLFAINAITFVVYGIDKYKAKKAKWRISEATLLFWQSLEEASGHGWECESGIIRRCTGNSNTAFLPFC